VSNPPGAHTELAQPRAAWGMVVDVAEPLCCRSCIIATRTFCDSRRCETTSNADLP